MYRFVICVDVEGPGLEEAYAQLTELMKTQAWHSTDEVYQPDGEPVDADTLGSAIAAYLDKKEEEGSTT